MNTDMVITLQNKIEELSATICNMEKIVNTLKINDQLKLNANNIIPPGIACKVAYDKNGLVVNGGKLEINDIPQLEISNINGLERHLNDKVSIRDLDKFKVDITTMLSPITKSVNDIAGTGIKINYNSEGRVISTADLLVSDIPILPIEKIEGLSTIIEELQFYVFSRDNIESFTPDITTHPGIFTKVTIDNHGRVINGGKLDINDIPIEIINQLNTIQSDLVNYAPRHSVDLINKTVNGKLDANSPITSGTYTKVKVDSKGLVTFGEKLSISDLPELTTSDIKDLDKIIRGKADQDDLLSVYDTIAGIANSLNKVGEVSAMRNELINKASNDDVKKLESKVNGIQHKMDTILNIIPSDMIMEQLNQIMDEMSSLSGRISAMENYLKMNGQV